MVPGVLAGLLLPILASVALIRLALPALWGASRTLAASLAILVALGFSSLLFALSIFAFGARWPLFVPLETLLWTMVLAGSLFAGRGRTFHSRPAHALTPIELAAALLLALTLALSLLHFYWTTVNAPAGVWDAQAIWTLRARFLSRGLDGHWRDAFQVALTWSHPNYPLMLPSSIARLWLYAGTESAAVPIVLAAIFAYATIGTLIGALFAGGRRFEAFIAGAVVLASYPFNFWGVAQISDVPLAAFVLAVTVLLSWIVNERPDQFRGPVTALLTFLAGCTAWTKNEGLVFALAVCAVSGAMIVWRGKSTLRTGIAALAGLSIPLAVLFYFKRNIAPPSYLFESFTVSNPPPWMWDAERHAYILRAFARELWAWNTARPIGIIPFVLAHGVGSAAICGLRRTQLIPAVPLIAMLAGYYGAYVITPLDLKWHVESSLGRLIVQVWPAMVYVCFAVAAPLSECAQLRRNTSTAASQRGI